MTLRSDFGWVIFVAFLFGIFRILQTGARSSGRGRAPPPQMPTGPRDGNQREGSELEELLRQLEGRLGGRSAGKVDPRPQIVVKRPAQTRPAAARPAPARSLPADESVASLEAGGDREAEAEALDRELTEVDHAAFEARIKSRSGQPAAAQSAVPRLTAQHLRDAVVWQEILGPPKGLQ